MWVTVLQRSIFFCQRHKECQFPEEPKYSVLPNFGYPYMSFILIIYGKHANTMGDPVVHLFIKKSHQCGGASRPECSSAWDERLHSRFHSVQ